MPRPKSPCGTYPAYQRHLREKTPVCDPCRRAQREHDAGRASAWRRGDRGPAAPVHIRVPEADPLVQRREDVREMFRKCAVDLLDFVRDDYLYGVIDVMGEMSDLLETWCDAQDALEARDGSRVPEPL